MPNSFGNFIPEIWSKKLEKIFDKIVVMRKLVNTDWEGEIRNAGNTVHIRYFGNVTCNTYTREMTITFQTLGSNQDQLTIDQQQYWAFLVDDLDKAQSDVSIMEGYASRAAIAIRNVIDTRLLGHYSDVPAGNVVGSAGAPIGITKDNLYDWLTHMGYLLDVANVSAEDRNFVFPPEIRKMMLQSPELRARGTIMVDETIKNGKIGTLAGFNLNVTTNMAQVSGAYPLMFFTRDFITFASQVSEVEKVRPYNMFVDAIKGLYLYGSKVPTSTNGSGALLYASVA